MRVWSVAATPMCLSVVVVAVQAIFVANIHQGDWETADSSKDFELYHDFGIVLSPVSDVWLRRTPLVFRMQHQFRELIHLITVRTSGGMQNMKTGIKQRRLSCVLKVPFSKLDWTPVILDPPSQCKDMTLKQAFIFSFCWHIIPPCLAVEC